MIRLDQLNIAKKISLRQNSCGISIIRNIFIRFISERSEVVAMDILTIRI